MNCPRSFRFCLAAAALVALLALALTACERTADAEEDTARAGDAVVVTDMAFTPEALTVPVGTTVIWTFDDGAIAHDVVFDDLAVASDQLTDDTFSHTFEEPGTYTYSCGPHPNMTGTIEVIP